MALTDTLLVDYSAASPGHFERVNHGAFTNNSAKAYKWFGQMTKRKFDASQKLNNSLRIDLILTTKEVVKGRLPAPCQEPGFKQLCQHYTAELRKL